MKKQINLIPSDMVVPRKIVNLSKLLNKISTVSTVVLVIAIISLIIVSVYLNIENRKSISKISELKNKIITLERSEQRLILAKDKLSKILYIKKIDFVDNELENFVDFQNTISLASGSALTEVAMDPGKIETSVVFSDSLNLSNILKSLSESNQKKFSKVILSSLGYNASSGFLANLILED